MKQALIWCTLISVLFVLTASGFGIAKIQDMVNVYWFSFICVVYFGMIFSTTGLIIYNLVKILKVVKQIIGELEKIGVKINNILNDLKAKLEKIPGFVWNMIFDILDIKKPKDKSPKK